MRVYSKFGGNSAVSGTERRRRHRGPYDLNNNRRLCQYRRRRASSQGIESSSLDAGNAIRAANADAQWPAADWWRAYNDPQLNAWIEAAQAGNPSLAAAQARVREAVSMAGVARSALSPQVNGICRFQRQKMGRQPVLRPRSARGRAIVEQHRHAGLSYHLDIWGKDGTPLSARSTPPTPVRRMPAPLGSNWKAMWCARTSRCR